MHCAPETLLKRGRETCWADFQDQKMLYKRLCGYGLTNRYCHAIFILQTKWKFLVKKRPNVLYFIYRPRQANLEFSLFDSLLNEVCKLAYPLPYVCTYVQCTQSHNSTALILREMNFRWFLKVKDCHSDHLDSSEFWFFGISQKSKFNNL